jgi:hypothetical protein
MRDGFAAAHSAHRGIIPYGGMDTANTALSRMAFSISSEVRSFSLIFKVGTEASIVGSFVGAELI